jgi:uncharacterized protein
MKHLRTNDYQTSSWAGGTTRQLLIFPETAQVKEKDFLFRISSAKIELEESEFTRFVGYKRILLTLDKPIQMAHDGQESIHLNPFDIHTFQGEWDTSAKGQCEDFNVIYRPTVEVMLEVHELKKGEFSDFKISPLPKFLFLFVVCGSVITDHFIAKSNESFFIETDEINSLQFSALEDSRLIAVSISF